MSEMLMKEPEMLLPRKQAVQSEIASRAVALCEGCPMAKLCASKNTGKCPPPEVKQQMLESIDIGDGGANTAPVSYRKQLLDDSIPSVMAQLTPKPVVKKPEIRPSHLPLPKAAPRPAPIAKTPDRRPSRPLRQKHDMSAIGQAVADIAHLMFGGAEPGAGRVKK